MANVPALSQQQLAALLASAGQSGAPQAAMTPVPPQQPVPMPQIPAAAQTAAMPTAAPQAQAVQMPTVGGVSPGQQAMSPVAAQAAAFRRAQMLAALQGQGLGLASAGVSAAPSSNLPNGNAQ